MERWLQPALDYISTWIEFQMRASQQPGCVFPVAHRIRWCSSEIWLSSIRLRPESKVATEMKRRFGAVNRAAKRRNALAPR